MGRQRRLTEKCTASFTLPLKVTSSRIRTFSLSPFTKPRLKSSVRRKWKPSKLPEEQRTPSARTRELLVRTHRWVSRSHPQLQPPSQQKHQLPTPPEPPLNQRRPRSEQIFKPSEIRRHLCDLAEIDSF